jgi:hypothetical protein
VNAVLASDTCYRSLLASTIYTNCKCVDVARTWRRGRCAPDRKTRLEFGNGVGCPLTCLHACTWGFPVCTTGNMIRGGEETRPRVRSRTTPRWTTREERGLGGVSARARSVNNGVVWTILSSTTNANSVNSSTLSGFSVRHVKYSFFYLT